MYVINVYYNYSYYIGRFLFNQKKEGILKLLKSGNRGDITINLTEIKMIVREYCE